MKTKYYANKMTIKNTEMQKDVLLIITLAKSQTFNKNIRKAPID